MFYTLDEREKKVSRKRARTHNQRKKNEPQRAKQPHVETPARAQVTESTRRSLLQKAKDTQLVTEEKTVIANLAEEDKVSNL